MNGPPRLVDAKWLRFKSADVEGAYDLVALKARVVAAAPGAIAVGGGASPAASLGTVVAGVAGGAGAAVMAIGLIVARMPSEPTSPSTVAAATTAAATTAAEEIVTTPIAAQTAPTAPLIAQATTTTPTTTTTTKQPTKALPAADAVPRSTLIEELAAYDDAVAALGAGHVDEAHRALVAHRARWPDSVLRPEVDLSDLEALLRAHRDDEAHALAAVLVDDPRLRGRRLEIKALLAGKSRAAGDSVGGGLP